MIISSGIARDGLSKNKVDPLGVCSLRVKAYSVFCVQCGMWIHGGCSRVKRVSAKFL